MDCPICESRTKVVDSRSYAGAVYRRRRCSTCGNEFITEEDILEEGGEDVFREIYSLLKMGQRDKKKGK